MEQARNSKLINETETELRSRLTHKGQRVLADEAGWHESKVSRLNLRDMATVFVLLEKGWETSLIAEVARQAVAAAMGKKRLKAFLMREENHEPKRFYCKERQGRTCQAGFCRGCSSGGQMQRLITIADVHQLQRKERCSMTAFTLVKHGQPGMRCQMKGRGKSERKEGLHNRACCKEKAPTARTVEASQITIEF